MLVIQLYANLALQAIYPNVRNSLAGPVIASRHPYIRDLELPFEPSSVVPGSPMPFIDSMHLVRAIIAIYPSTVPIESGVEHCYLKAQYFYKELYLQSHFIHTPCIHAFTIILL